MTLINQSGEVVLEINNIDSFYGELQILWGVSLEVKKSKITVVIGSNGAGKTTLLKTVSGLVPAKSGSIKFDGLEISNKKPYHIPKLGIAHVPEGRSVFPNLSVIENIELGAYTKRARHRMKENLSWCLELFPILKLREKQLAGTMSGGEQQMIAISRGLMADPKLLILDEPSLGLMPLLVEELFGVIRKINQEGVSILLVEQNVQEAVEICNSYCVLETGRIVHKGIGGEFLDDELLKSAYLGS
jgi:branched-chain amino acid transport system ATP-binding protein